MYTSIKVDPSKHNVLKIFCVHHLFVLVTCELPQLSSLAMVLVCQTTELNSNNLPGRYRNLAAVSERLIKLFVNSPNNLDSIRVLYVVNV